MALQDAKVVTQDITNLASSIKTCCQAIPYCYFRLGFKSKALFLCAMQPNMWTCVFLSMLGLLDYASPMYLSNHHLSKQYRPSRDLGTDMLYQTNRLSGSLPRNLLTPSSKPQAH